MRRRHRRRATAPLAVAVALLTAGCAIGPGGAGGSVSADPADYPSGPIEVVVPYDAGGATDQTMRALTKPVGDRLGTEPMVTTNQPGGAGTIGTTRVVAASPDGYTLGFIAGGPVTVQPHYGRTIYAPEDLRAVAQVSVSPIVLAVPADSPWQSVEDFVADAKVRPGTVQYASTGVGNPANLAMEKLDEAAEIETVQVPFESSSETVTAVLGGTVDAAAGSPSGFLSSVRSGDLRILANLGSVKGAGLESIPTLAESGYPVATDIRSGFIAPQDLPQPYVDEIAAAVGSALQDPEVRRQIELGGAVPEFAGPRDYADHIAREYAETGKVLHDAGLL